MVKIDQIYQSFQFVIENSKFVTIDKDAIKAYVSTFQSTVFQHWSSLYPLGYKRKTSDQDELDFLFLIGNQAFCFWGYPQKWNITYKKKQLDGWWALIACFERALEAGIPILDGNYLSQLSLNQTQVLFAGIPEIPLLKERQQMLKQIGNVLVKKYHGFFHYFYQQAKKDAITLIGSIADLFAGFDDAWTYQGQNVYFYKKAQVVVNDIYEIFQGKGYGAITNIDQFPGHADYKIPAILRKLGILKYSQPLAKLVDNRKLIPSGSEMEIEIRANMLWATKLIVKMLKPQFPDITSVRLNGILWNQSQSKSQADKPYHLTTTIYY